MIELIELFAGIGSQTQALKNIGVPHRVAAISEINQEAERSYRILHGDKAVNLGDIRRIERLPHADIWTYSFPCQDISSAGKQAGIRDGAHSGLLKEVSRLLQTAEQLPDCLLMENVGSLAQKSFLHEFGRWLVTLRGLGYTNTWAVLNAKDYGIAQNRERTFCVSQRGERRFRFPSAILQTHRLGDYLDKEVCARYQIDGEIAWNINPADCFESVNQPLVIGRLTGGKWDRARDLARRIYSRYGIAPTLTTGCSGSTIFKVISSDGRSVRSATPIEYWRLMGWKDAQIQRIIDAKTSPTQMYKQAGNSIALPVLEHLFRELYGGNHEKNSNG